jgi:hypothetical protein
VLPVKGAMDRQILVLGLLNRPVGVSMTKLSGAKGHLRRCSRMRARPPCTHATSENKEGCRTDNSEALLAHHLHPQRNAVTLSCRAETCRRKEAQTPTPPAHNMSHLKVHVSPPMMKCHSKMPFLSALCLNSVHVCTLPPSPASLLCYALDVRGS